MSTLTVQTISNGPVSTSSANVIQGSAKAWVNFNGQGTVAIRSSYNVSSITDNGVGDYTVNFTTAMPNANYALAGAAEATGAASIGVLAYYTSGTRTTSAVRVSTTQSGVGLIDLAVVSVSVFD